MSKITSKIANLARRQHRIRATVIGTSERPRMSVFISNRNITAQIIDDSTHKTVAYVTTVGSKVASGTMTDKAVWVGEQIAKKAKAVKVTKIVMDRNGKQYHGRIKALAEAARAGGLEF